MCVSVIANDRSESSLMSTKPVCITSYQLIKIRMVFLFLKKTRRKYTWASRLEKLRKRAVTYSARKKNDQIGALCKHNRKGN